MGKTISTKFLNVAKTFNLTNKVSGFTIPGEYCYEWNLITDGIAWMGKVYKKLGYKKSSFPKTHREWEDKMIHPLDRQRVKKSRYQHLKTGGNFSTRYRVKQEKGDYISLSVQGKAIRNSQGTPYKWKGSIQLHPDKQTH